MLFTPCSRRTTKGSSATLCVSWESAAAPKITRVLRCPVRPNSVVSIAMNPPVPICRNPSASAPTYASRSVPQPVVDRPVAPLPGRGRGEGRVDAGARQPGERRVVVAEGGTDAGVLLGQRGAGGGGDVGAQRDRQPRVALLWLRLGVVC